MTANLIFVISFHLGRVAPQQSCFSRGPSLKAFTIYIIKNEDEKYRRIYIDEKRHLQTTLYTKPTDTHNYLHFKSSHPRHLKESLPYSQALRLRRICSENNKFIKHSDKLKEQFTARGYSQTLVENQIKKAIAIPREAILKLAKKEKINRISFVTTFNNTLPPLAQIIQNRWDILKLKPNLKDIFREPGMLAYRRPMNLKEMIGSNIILDNKVNRRISTIKTIKFCQPCNTRNSLCCNHLKTTNSFTSFVTKNKYKIYHESNCKSKNVIYLLECTYCSNNMLESQNGLSISDSTTTDIESNRLTTINSSLSSNTFT